MMDVSKRKQVEDVRRLVQFSVDSADFSIIWLGADGKILYANEGASLSLGYSRQELLSMTIMELDPDYSAEHFAAAWKSTKESGALVFKSRHRKKNGQIIPVEISAKYLQFDGREFSCTFSRDISDRKAAEEARRNAHRESELFINCVPSILIGLDLRGRVQRWNLTAAATFGISKANVRGKPLKDCGIHWLNPKTQAEIDSWLSLTGSKRCEDLSFEKNGEPHSLGVTVNPIKFADEKQAGLLITGADTTERMHLEEQLRQSQKLEAIGQLAAGIAHEINTPIQYVANNTAFIKESWESVIQLLALCETMRQEAASGPVSAESIATLERLVKHADVEYLQKEMPNAINQSLEGLKRVAQIVKAMKEFSHPGSDEKAPIDINRSIETTIAVARNEWKYVADVITDFDSSLPPVPCFQGQFNQVILNLIVNAAHAIASVVGDGSQEKRKITITTRQVGESAEIAIQDAGPGIPAEIRSRVFEPFFTTKAVGKGTGQGLALAHATIVKAHQGRIWFETEVGRGTTFFIQLPLEVPVTAAAAVH